MLITPTDALPGWRGKTIAERFWSKVDRSGGPDACWLWLGVKVRNSQWGRIWLHGKRELAHAVSWWLTRGPVSDGVRVLHCRMSQNCVNPEHLSLESMADRFWSKVDVRGPDECWPWKAGKRNVDGYGDFSVAHRHHVGAHRMAWQLATGFTLDSDVFACHSCDRKGCCNFRHIFPGTNADNQADMVAKGRQASGDRHGSRLHPESRPRGENHWSARRRAATSSIR